jgi:hypothetical protein
VERLQVDIAQQVLWDPWLVSGFEYRFWFQASSNSEVDVNDHREARVEMCANSSGHRRRISSQAESMGIWRLRSPDVVVLSTVNVMPSLHGP